MQRRVAAGVLSAGHARTLLASKTPDVQDRLAGPGRGRGHLGRGLEEIVAVGDLRLGRADDSPQPPDRAGARRPRGPALDRLETRVKVDLGKRKGRITVEFASLPDLERIIGVIDPATTGT